ncbi:DMP19 family protein [Jannaschia ovalis]|uniref:DNA mimic protein DMP19 C-terminal domain-containing protein n=1 Tax=Jannaschia ovalis TaxID=3038773 RepID=A0ABY8LD06_9RHOB|nr:hypothetical protein [Jannaschia sp. GRR-S6-38]WGH79021.1 hypothetical protein P8627_01815 [Jannaschia sp. GRR-S6-38]
MFHYIFPGARRKRVIVPDAVLGPDAQPYALIGAVVDWTNAARDRGFYAAGEIDEVAPQAYNADYYYAQVCNGGHAQFRHNSRMDPLTIAHALTGLRAAGLEPLAACLAELEAAGENADTTLCEALDSRFFAANDVYHAKMNAWLRPRVQIVPARAYDRRMAAFLKRDRRRERRFQDRQALRLQGLSESGDILGFAWAAMKQNAIFDRVMPGRFVTALGRETVLWGILTGPAGAQLRLEGIALNGLVIVAPDLPSKPAFDDEDLRAAAKAGAYCSAKDIAMRTDLAGERKLGATVAFLIAEAKGVQAEDVSAIVPLPGRTDLPDGRIVASVTLRGGAFLVATFLAEASVLSDTDGREIARLSAAEIARRHAELETPPTRH